MWGVQDDDENVEKKTANTFGNFTEMLYNIYEHIKSDGAINKTN